ncbi:hypothetical protein CHUAL_005572 [Chamberlinius hualienensis]
MNRFPYFTSNEKQENFTTPCFLHLKRSYVEEVTVIPERINRFQAPFDPADTPTPQNSFTSLKPTSAANTNTPLSNEMISPLVQSEYYTNQNGYPKVVPNLNATGNSSRLALLASENSGKVEILSRSESGDNVLKPSAIGNDGNTSLMIGNDHCYSREVEIEDLNDFIENQSHPNVFIDEVTVSAEQPIDTSEYIWQNDENTGNLVPDNNMIYVDVEEINRFYETFDKLIDDNDLLDDVESTAFGIFCEERHDDHVCPVYESIKAKNNCTVDQNVPEIGQMRSGLVNEIERPIYKNQPDETEVNKKSLRVGLSKKQKLNPLHVLKF